MRVQFACPATADETALHSALATLAEGHAMRWSLHAASTAMKTVLMVSSPSSATTATSINLRPATTSLFTTSP